MISQSTFDKAAREFDRREGRAKFFPLAEHLIATGFEVEACILLLATWNSTRFRIAVTRFDVDEFRRTLARLRRHFDALKRQSIESVDLSRYGACIKTVFRALSKIKGIEFTGAAKVMHLKNPKLFVMWDTYIRGGATGRYYDQLEIVKSGEWIRVKYGTSAEEYLRFLEDMKARFRHLSPPSVNKTLAKAIDEFNYVNITLPIQAMERLQRKARRKAGED